MTPLAALTSEVNRELAQVLLLFTHHVSLSGNVPLLLQADLLFVSSLC